MNMFPFGAFFGKAALYALMPLGVSMFVAMLFRFNSNLKTATDRRDMLSKLIAAIIALGLVCCEFILQRR